MSEMITRNHALVAQFGDSLDRLLDSIEKFVTNSRPAWGSERFLTDRKVLVRFKVSHHTLQEHSNSGMIAYYPVFGRIFALAVMTVPRVCRWRKEQV